ncbi:MAG: permease, partial [Burkholderiaceae bacterium]
MQRALAYERTPGLMAPLRFFLTAPPFALAAALLLLWQGEAALQTRWAPATLALTHLLTLGFLASAMTGALMQILPVVAGVELPRPNGTAAGVHGLLLAGTALLAAAFWFSRPLLFTLALVCLSGAFGWLLAACTLG